MKEKPVMKDEVKITDLFSQIGRGFRTMGKAIANGILSLYYLFLDFILFLKKNILIVGGAALLGLIIGIIKDLSNTNSGDLYYAALDVKVTSGSGNLLYNRIDNINDLITGKDSVALSEILHIPVEKTKLIHEINITPIDKKNEINSHYELFRLTTDTIVTNHVDFNQYTKRFTDGDLLYHTVTIYAEEPEILKEVAGKITSLAQNEYYASVWETKYNQLKFKQKEIIHNLEQIDTLRKQKLIIEKLKASNPANYSDFNLTNNSRKEMNYYDVEMIKTSGDLLQELDMVNRQLEDFDNMVKIITPLSYPVPYSSITAKNWFRYALYGLVLSILVLAALRFNTYLTRYEKNRSTGS